MEVFLKDSYIYKILLIVKKWFSKIFKKSYFVQSFLSDRFNSENLESSFMVSFLNILLKWIRKIAKKLKFDKIFENSIFAKPLIWTTITIFLAPILPTMVVLVLSLASMASLILKASIDDNFKFKHYKINIWVIIFAIVIAISAIISISMEESIKIALLMISFVLFYFVVINVVTTRKELKIILYAMLMAAAFTAFYGVRQYMYGDVYSQAWLDEEMFEDITPIE